MMPSRPLPATVFALLLAPFLAACAAVPVPGSAYTLTPRQTADLALGMRLTFDSVSDSRCPPDVRCIRAGTLALRFVLDGPDGREAFTLGPDQPSAAPRALHGARIALDPAALPPARAASQAQAANALPVTLKVTRR